MPHDAVQGATTPVTYEIVLSEGPKPIRYTVVLNSKKRLQNGNLHFFSDNQRRAIVSWSDIYQLAMHIEYDVKYNDYKLPASPTAKDKLDIVSIQNEGQSFLADIYVTEVVVHQPGKGKTLRVPWAYVLTIARQIRNSTRSGRRATTPQRTPIG